VRCGRGGKEIREAKGTKVGNVVIERGKVIKRTMNYNKNN
jgi:hypothetical protein